MGRTREIMKTVIDACTKKESMAVLFLCGILLFVIMLPTENNGSYQKEDSGTSNINISDEDTYYSYKQSRENELKDFLESVSGVGSANVLMYIDDTSGDVPVIEGVIVAAQGAKDENVRVLIARLVMALYGVEANKVEVTLLTR